MLRESEPGVGQHLQHGVVLDEHLRLDPAHAAVPCQCEQVLEEQGAETLAVMGVGDQESDLDGVDGLGVGGPGADELCGREPLEVTIDLGDQR